MECPTGGYPIQEETISDIFCLEHELVSQDVTTTASAPQLHVIDLSIPTSKYVTGSGVLVLQVRESGVLTDIDSLVTPTLVVSAADDFHVFDGPHPTDSTKWRVMVTQGSADIIKFRAWITAIG